MSRKPDGLCLVHKQPGMTSFDCIRALKRTWGRTDLGHGGTLDKFASGVLPVLAGEGLKLVRFFLESYPALPTYWKSYSGTFEFGVATETGDPEGEITERSETSNLTIEAVNAAMASFTSGVYEQLPPRFSAKKIGGNRASDLARAGKELELKAVPVTIKSFNCPRIEGNLVHFEVICSKGTYVRSLAVDLARKLGSVAYVKTLCRTAVGDFKLDQALTLEQIAMASPEDAIPGLAHATSFLPPYELLARELDELRVGKVDGVLSRLSNSGLGAGVYCARSERGPVALLELDSAKHAHFLRAFA